MQPTANIIARAACVVGALDEPLDDVDAGRDLAARADPDRSRRPAPTSALCTVIRPSVSGMPTWSSNSSGAAPVPPSEPSTTMKSGSRPPPPSPCRWRGLAPGADAELEAGGLAAGQLRMPGDEPISSTGVWKTGGRRADALLALRHAARLGDLPVTFAPGSTPPMPGLAPWLSLSETHLTRVARPCPRSWPGRSRRPGRGSRSSPCRSPRRGRRRSEVVGRQAALAGVVREPAERRALVEGADRVGGQGAEAHRRHVEQRHGVGLGAVRTADEDARRHSGGSAGAAECTRYS